MSYSLLTGLVLSLTVAFARAEQPQTFKPRVESAFDCKDAQVVITGTPTINLYFMDGTVTRVASTMTNQIFLQGNDLMIQSSDGRSSLLATLTSEPACEIYELGEVPPRYKPSWNEADLTSALTLDKKTVAQPQTCKELRTDLWTRTERIEIRVNDAAQNIHYLLLSSGERLFTSKDLCQTTP